MTRHELHRIAKQGDCERARALLSPNGGSEAVAIDAYDRHGFTPLMHAAQSPAAGVEMVRLLLAQGARIDQESRGAFAEVSLSVISLALQGGDPEKVAALLEAGADLHYRRAHGYDALIDAVHGRDVLRDDRLIELLQLLIASGVALSGVTTYHESGLRVLSRLGRFDAVHLLLLNDADPGHLQFTPLIEAVAFGSLADVDALAIGPSLEEVDWWERTAWLIAIQTGELPKALLLLERGANPDARGRCGKPPLHYAVENHHPSMLGWLLELGLDVEQTDDFGVTPLMAAVQCADAECVDVLLQAGADVARERAVGQTALSDAGTPAIAMRLLEAGADPRHLAHEGRRTLLGLAPDPDEDLLDCSPEEFRRARTRRFGTANPELMSEPFWDAMIRAGVTGYAADRVFPSTPIGQRGLVVRRPDPSPVWCAQRFGQSTTFLPDGRIVQIAGEHEDSYDPDFCIYNDVFVHAPDGTIRIFGYPESVFPPTDFHTATLVDGSIYLIGSLGYRGTRRYGETPVYRLDTTFAIARVDAGGDAPGWIYQHRAVLCSAHEIRVTGGKIVSTDGDREVHARNGQSFVLDIERSIWRVEHP